MGIGGQVWLGKRKEAAIFGSGGLADSCRARARVVEETRRVAMGECGLVCALVDRISTEWETGIPGRWRQGWGGVDG